MQQFQGGVAALTTRIDDVNKEARRGIAAVAAMAPVVMPSARRKTTISASTGFYQGETGLGIGFAHRLDVTMPVVIYGSYGNAAGREHVGRAGVAFEF